MTYPAEVLADTPLVYWRLGDTSGTTAADASGNGRAGTYGGSPTLGAASLLTGDANTSVSFDGVDDRVVIGGAAWQNVAALTCEAIIKSTATGARSIADRDSNTTAARVFQFRQNASKVEFIRIRTAGGVTSIFTGQSTTNINDGVRHHVVATYDGTNIRIYVDGALESTTAAAGGISQGSTVADFSLGVNRSTVAGSAWFLGQIDEFAYYGTALSGARIAAHAAAMAAAAGPTPKWWDGAARQPATLRGWWNGSSLQPVTVKGWWDGSNDPAGEVMRVAVHTIARDEAGHVERWAKSAAAADHLAIADTGSTDETADVAAACGVVVTQVRVVPFRFDTARNAGLAALPGDVDVVVTLDLDEVLVDGWRDDLERAYADAPHARRWSYEYVWSWLAPGVPDVRFTADRCHARDGWRWHGAVHEVLAPADCVGGVTYPARFTIEHHPDATKSRGGYLALLEAAVVEEPHNPRQRFYLAREYFFHDRWDDARPTFVTFLAMAEATWPAERAEAYRYLARMDDDPERWLLHAVAEDPGRRDAVVDLVDMYLAQERFSEAAGMAARALRVTDRPGDYMTTARVWDDARLRKVLMP